MEEDFEIFCIYRYLKKYSARMILIINKNKLIEEYIAKKISKKIYVFDEPIAIKNNKYLTKIIGILAILKIYILIKKYKIKIVLTSIDNSPFFHKISKVFKKQKFYAIQNGFRSKKELKLKNKNNLTNFFCFGNNEILNYNEFGHKATNFLPIGNFKVSIYKDYFSNNIKNNDYDLCFISQIGSRWAFYQDKDIDGNKLDENLRELKKESNELINCLKKISKKNNLKLCVVTRGDINSKEYAFFKENFSSKEIDILPKKSEFSSYDYIEKSSLVISIFSTLCIEAIELDKKILFIDTSIDNRFAYFNISKEKKELCTYLENDLGNLEKKILYLLKMEKIQYKESSKDFANFIIDKDSNNTPTYQRIKNRLILDII